MNSESTPHTEAAGIISAKLVVTKAVSDQLLPELRCRVFTVTGIETVSVLQSLRDQIASLPRGANWEDVKAGLVNEMSPYLGEEGARQRATLLLRTHAFQAFQTANWRLAQEDEDTTHLQYLATEDKHVRHTHLALNGVILPKDDPFWDEHYPPWEWNCRCQVRSMNPDMVADEKEADKKRKPEQNLVFEGAMLKKLQEGELIRFKPGTEISTVYHVFPPQGKTAFRFHPKNLRISLDVLQARYEPQVFAQFQAFAKATEIQAGLTVWAWAAGTSA